MKQRVPSGQAGDNIKLCLKITPRAPLEEKRPLGKMITCRNKETITVGIYANGSVTDLTNKCNILETSQLIFETDFTISNKLVRSNENIAPETIPNRLKANLM